MRVFSQMDIVRRTVIREYYDAFITDYYDVDFIGTE